MRRIALALLLFSLAGCRGVREPKVIYGVGSNGRHSLVPRLGVEGKVSKRTTVRAVWLPEFPVEVLGTSPYTTRAPSRELGGFEIECSTELR